MELRQLKYFVEVAGELHFSRAAEKLYISQSALSQQIRLLEEELGVQLFDTDKRLRYRSVVLTELGKSFLKDAEEIIRLSEKAVRNVRNMNMQSKELRIGFFKLALRSWIIEIVNRISESLPEYNVKIVEFPTVEGVQDGLLNRKIDVGMTLLPLKDERLSASLHKRDHLTVIMSKNHLLADREVILLDELGQEKWVIINKPLHPYYKYIEGLCRKAGFSREENIAQEVASHEMLCNLVSLNEGVAFMPYLFDLSKESEIIAKKVLINKDHPKEIEVNHAIAWNNESNFEWMDKIKKLLDEK